MTTVREAAGRDARDCGLVPLPSSRAAAVSCANAALGDNRPFSVIFQVQGIDSTVYYALARGADGRVEQLTWDSDVSGGSSLMARRRISRDPCPEASIQDADGVPPVVCSGR